MGSLAAMGKLSPPASCPYDYPAAISYCKLGRLQISRAGILTQADLTDLAGLADLADLTGLTGLAGLADLTDLA